MDCSGEQMLCNRPKSHLLRPSVLRPMWCRQSQLPLGLASICAQKHKVHATEYLVPTNAGGVARALAKSARPASDPTVHSYISFAF